MESKRERLMGAARRLDALACPVCGSAMRAGERGFVCGEGHTLDANKKGYVYCLRRPHPTYYDQALFAARRQVFDAGCYAPVLAAVEALLPAGAHRLLDAGCGEGYYLDGLLAAHRQWQGAGVDISREAIEQAANRSCAALWCVGDLRALPFRTHAFTALVDVLTPANYNEFRRVLAPDGWLIKAYPGAEYLQEIRQARELPPYEEGQVGEYMKKHCQNLRETRVCQRFSLTPELWRAFVWMTPMNQDLSSEEKAALCAQPAKEITIDMQVTAGRLTGTEL